MILRVGVALALFVTSVAAQRTWIVDADNRPGADFADLPAAVAAAQPGDTLMLRSVAWPYTNSYTPVPIDKGIRLVGDGLHWGACVFSGPLQIRNLPAGQTVIVQALPMEQLFNAPAGAGINCQNCAGAIHIDRQRPTSWGYWSQLSFTDCSNVSVCDSFIILQTSPTVTRTRLRVSRARLSVVYGAYEPTLRGVDSTIVSDRFDFVGCSSYWQYSCGQWTSAGGTSPAPTRRTARSSSVRVRRSQTAAAGSWPVATPPSSIPA